MRQWRRHECGHVMAQGGPGCTGRIWAAVRDAVWNISLFKGQEFRRAVILKIGIICIGVGTVNVHAPARMIIGDGAADGTFVDVQINLRCGDGAVTEQLLNKLDVGALFEQERGKGMADHVRSYVFVDAGQIGVFSEKKTDALRGHLFSVARDKDMRIMKSHQKAESEIIFVEHQNRRLNNIGFSFLAALAEDAYRPGGKIHAFHRQIAELLNTNSGGEHSLENQTVSDVDDAFHAGIAVPAADIVIVGGIDDPVNFLFAQRFRKKGRLADFDVDMIKRGIFQQLFRDSIFEKCVDDGFFLENRGSFECLVQGLDICVYFFACDFFDFRKTETAGESIEGFQRGGVSFYSVRG